MPGNPLDELDALPDDDELDELAALPDDATGDTLESIDAERAAGNAAYAPTPAQPRSILLSDEDEGGFDPMSGASPSQQREGGLTLKDMAVSGTQGALMNYGDELSGLVGGPEAEQAFNDNLSLANRRSPIAAPLAHVGGELFPSLAAPGAGLGARVATAAMTGGLASSGNAQEGQRLEQFGQGALTSGATAGVLGGAGKLSEGLAPHAPEVMKRAFGTAAPSLAGAYHGFQRDGYRGALVEGLGGAAAGYAAGKIPSEGIARTLGTGMQVAALPAGVAAAEAMSDDYGDERTQKAAFLASMGTVDSRAGLELSNQSANAAGREPTASEVNSASQGATNMGRGNLLGDAAIELMQTDPGKLGEYQAEFSQAYVSNDVGAMNALITKLANKDPKFRTTTLVELQRLTSEGR